METHYTEVRVVITRRNDNIIANTEDTRDAFRKKELV